MAQKFISYESHKTDIKHILYHFNIKLFGACFAVIYYLVARTIILIRYVYFKHALQ